MNWFKKYPLPKIHEQNCLFLACHCFLEKEESDRYLFDSYEFYRDDIKNIAASLFSRFHEVLSKYKRTNKFPSEWKNEYFYEDEDEDEDESLFNYIRKQIVFERLLELPPWYRVDYRHGAGLARLEYFCLPWEEGNFRLGPKFSITVVCYGLKKSDILSIQGKKEIYLNNKTKIVPLTTDEQIDVQNDSFHRTESCGEAMLLYQDNYKRRTAWSRDDGVDN